MKRSLIILLVVTGIAINAFAQKPDSSAKPAAKLGDAPSALPSAKAVIDKYIAAIGGRDALKDRRSRYQTGTIELSPMGLKGTVESFSRSDDRSLTKLNIDGVGEILEGYDGTTAWTVNPIQGSRVKEGKELLQTKRNSTFRRELDIDKIYSSLRVRGIEKVGDRDTYVVVASSESLPDDIMYFDTETGLMLRSDGIAITPEGEQAITSFLEDYRDVDGIKTAHKVRAKTPAFEIITLVTGIKYGVAMEDAIFSRPK